MKYLVWVIRLIIFIVVVLFALRNTQETTINFFGGYAAQDIPLIVLLLIAFVLGAILAYLFALPTYLKLKFQIKQLQAQVKDLKHHIETNIREEVYDEYRHKEHETDPHVVAALHAPKQ